MKSLEQNKTIKLLYCASDNHASSGAFLAMIELCSNLKKYHNVSPLIILPRDGEGTKLVEASGLEYKIIRSEDWVISNKVHLEGRIRKIKKSLKNIIAICKLMRLIKKNNIDVVHLNTIFTYVGAIAGYLTHTPVVWHIREAIEYAMDSKIFFGNIGFKIINKSNAKIAVSNTVKNAYPKISFDNFNVVYDGVDESKFYQPNKQIFNNDDVQLICNSAIYKQKGQLDLIEACKILLEKGYKNWKLNFYGTGELKSLDKQINEYNLQSYINVNGYTDKLPEKLENADIVVVPSHYEGFGRVTAEGMLSGCLVIGSNIAGTTELIDDKETGLLYEVKNPVDLADKIIWAMNNQDLCRDIAKNGRQKIINNFTSKHNAENVYKVLEKINA